MPLRFTARVLEHLAHGNYQPSTIGAIARDLRVESDERDAFDESIRLLREEKKIEVDQGGLVHLPNFPDEVTGRFRLNERGFGFVIPDQRFRDGDLFVPPGETGGAVSRDRVRAEVVRGGRGRGGGGRSGFVGRIIEVIERGQDHFVGTLFKDGANWFVEPDGRSIHDPVLIRDPHAKNAKEGSKVVIDLVHYPDQRYLAEGVIVKVLGEAGRPDVETAAVIEAHGLRTEFDDAIIDEARKVSKAFDKEAEGPWKNREDLTEQFIFTIDPPDAKDFDDAISLEYDAKADEYTLGVHIADVSHFVRPDSELDKEAKLRGTSVYLPRLVIPMLPEVLSNGVCSLQEGVNRFAKSAFITLDGKGRVISQRVASTVIRSAKRLTYLEAQALIDGDQKEARKHTRTDANYTDALVEKLKLSNKLARIIEKRRHKYGMIVLNLPEVELVFDDDGHVIDAVPEDNAYTHKIIEMFMVEANEALARLFEDLHVPILRRIHPDPTHGDMAELQMYAMAAKQRISEEPDRFDLQRLLDATRGTSAVRAIHFAVLRTLAKASYSPALIGHFALASEHYAHFTSPIRRYPDLTLHRAVEAYIELTDNGRNVPGGKKRKDLTQRLLADDRIPNEGELIELGRHCSEAEVEATFAERELREFLVMQFLKEHHLGSEFPGVITGVANRGVYISIEQFLVEGMIAMKDMPQSGGKPDRWQVNESIGRIYASRSGQALAVGDIVTVQIAAVDLSSRHLDLLITKFPERSRAHDLPQDEDIKHGKRKERGGKPPGRGGKGKTKGAKSGKGKRRSRK